MATKYLYGAAVQGIQDFIFRTSKLKAIVGASELVERICTDMFEEFAEGKGENVIRAAGNIKFIFNNREDCEKAVHDFTRMVMEKAPGITVSQAVVELNDGDSFSDKINELEAKLREQRNRPVRSLTLGFTGVERSRQTGLPAVEAVKGECRDMATKMKEACSTDANSRLCKKMFDTSGHINDFSDFVGQNDWLAVIHADGNGLGQVVQRVGGSRDDFVKFSKYLDEATVEAARAAFGSLPDDVRNAKTIPMRPIVLGGDDLTVVCRADLALPFVEAFLREFERSTVEKLGDILRCSNVFSNGDDRLTACAGVAYIKSSYPFYYGYQLAEALCSQAKADAKKGLVGNDLPKSCLSLYKVQDSFVESLDEMQRREKEPCEGHSFVFGPYYLDEHNERWTIAKLKEGAEKLGEDRESNAVKSGLRRWMSAMHEGESKANQLKKRLIAMTSKKQFVEIMTDGEMRDDIHCYPVYDLLAVNTINNQKTKEHND